jgi:hypothetical protein
MALPYQEFSLLEVPSVIYFFLKKDFLEQKFITEPMLCAAKML